MRSLLDQEMEQNAELRKEAEQLRSKLTESKDNYEVLVKESEKLTLFVYQSLFVNFSIKIPYKFFFNSQCL